LELKAVEGGALCLRGFLDSEGGALLRSALEPLARPSGESDDRSRERRFADALVELAGHTLDSGVLPQHAGQRPHLQVTATLASVQGREGAPAAELDLGGPIAAETARRLGCDAEVTRVDWPVAASTAASRGGAGQLHSRQQRGGWWSGPTPGRTPSRN
jgi:hypothetical protein